MQHRLVPTGGPRQARNRSARQRTLHLIGVRGSYDYGAIDGFQHSDVVRRIAKGYAESAGIALQGLSNRLTFASVLKDVVKAAAASPAKTVRFQVGDQLRSAIGVEDLEWLGMFALSGEPCGFDRQRRSLGNFLSRHLMKTADLDTGSAGGFVQPLTKPSVVAGPRSVFRNVVAGQIELAPQTSDLSPRLAGHDDERNAPAANLLEGRLRRLPRVGIVVEQGTI